MERRWQKVAARDGAVEARGVNEGRLALAICSRVFVCRPSEAQDRVGRGLEGAGGFEGNAKGTRRLTRRERKRNAKGMRSEKREGNAKPKGMLKAEKGIRRGVTTSRARAPRACAVPVRVPRNSHARARRPAMHDAAHAVASALWLGVGVERHLPKAMPRNTGKTLNPPLHKHHTH